MTDKILTVKITCEDVDIEQIKEELKEWYFARSSVGMYNIEFEE